MSALEVANVNRFAIRDMRVRLKEFPGRAGAPAAADILAGEGWRSVSHLQLAKFLDMVPGLGPSRVRRVCKRADGSFVWPLYKLGELTPGMRESVVAGLRECWLEEVPEPEAVEPKVKSDPVLQASGLLDPKPLRAFLLKELCRRESKAELAAEVGVSEREIARILNGEHRRIQFDTADRIVTGLGEHLFSIYPWDESDD